MDNLTNFFQEIFLLMYLVWLICLIIGAFLSLFLFTFFIEIEKALSKKTHLTYPELEKIGKEKGNLMKGPFFEGLNCVRSKNKSPIIIPVIALIIGLIIIFSKSSEDIVYVWLPFLTFINNSLLYLLCGYNIKSTISD